MRGTFIHCGEFIPRATARPLSLVQRNTLEKYLGCENFNFTFILMGPNICHVITCRVHSMQTQVSLSAQQRPPWRTRLRWDSIFFSTHIVTCAKKNPRVLSPQASLQKLSPLVAKGDEQLPRIVASSLFWEGKPTFILHRRASSASLLDQRSPLWQKKRYIMKSD